MEREHKKKQEALTLEETKQQIQNFETKLTQLKEEKHQLFNTLKKVRLAFTICNTKEKNFSNELTENKFILFQFFCSGLGG